MIQSNCANCGSKKSIFIKEQQTMGILSNLGIKTLGIKQTGDTRYIYRNELDKACFQHDSAYADHKDLINRIKSDKILRDKAYNIASNPEYDGYQRRLASMVYKSFDKKSMGSGINSSSIIADELH